MQRGLINKILKFHDEYFREDFINAPTEFFESDTIPDEFYTDDQVEGLFTEWFIFDYKLANGRLVLENYIKENFDDLPKKEIIACKNLLDNEFGFFLVKKVRKGQGLTLESLMREKIYEVREKNGTKIVSGGEVMVTRVAKVDDHWEIVSGEGFIFGKFSFGKNIIKLWQKDSHDKFTPKEFYWQFHKKRKDTSNEDDSGVIGENKNNIAKYTESIDPQNAKEDFKKFLKKYKLEQYFNTEIVQEWFYDLGLENSKSPFRLMSDIVFVFHSLIMERLLDDITMNELMVVLGNLHNTTPLKRLQGKTPQEMIDNELPKDYKPQIETDIREFSLKAINNFNKATNLIKKEKINRAEKLIQKGFSELFEERLIFLEPYRVFINLANIYIIKDNLKGAEQIVNMTLELNPNYSLGKTIKRELEKFKKGIVKSERKRQKNKTIEWEDIISSRDRLLSKNSPALKYYNFLKKTKINFATKKPTIDKHNFK